MADDEGTRAQLPVELAKPTLTAFFSLEVGESTRTGVLVEYDTTDKIFTNPSDKRTEDYVTGRFG